MKMTHALSALSLLCLVASSPAFAADAAPAQSAVVEACKPDVETLCPGVKPGDGRIKACLRKNRAKVSDGCKAALKEQRAAKKAAAQ